MADKTELKRATDGLEKDARHRGDFFGLRSRGAARRDSARAGETEWQSFPDLPGTHLYLRREIFGRYKIEAGAVRREIGQYKIEAADGSLVATVQDYSRAGRSVHASLPLTGPAFQSQGPLTITAGEKIYDVNELTRLSRWDWYQKGSAQQPHMKAVDRTTGERVLSLIGRHLDRKANSVIHFSENRWFELPVTGSSLRKSVMKAVDESGNVALRFRLTVSRLKFAVEEMDVEVALEPTIPVSADTALVVALASGSLRNYFLSSTGQRGA
jgi:hypothetical protein